MEHQFTFRVPNDCSTNGAANNATAPSCPSGCAEPAQTFGASNSPIRGLGTSAGGNMASLATSMATSVGSKRKRACSEMPEEERPGKKHFVPSREVTLKDHNGLPVKVQFDSYNDPDDELELPAGGIPEDVDADITDLVPRDPQASYNHPWADIPGIVDSVLEEGSKETVAISDDSAESLYAIAMAYAKAEMIDWDDPDRSYDREMDSDCSDEDLMDCLSESESESEEEEQEDDEEKRTDAARQSLSQLTII